jgi:GABA(A) receptor-associated protein|tara:strand:+ start:1809 stop:2180 length:372 start_codon:yes stop_codon:yes gene_type:complete
MSYYFRGNNYQSVSETSDMDARLDESSKVLRKYPDRIPVIVEPATNDLEVIKKNKFIVSKDMTFGQLTYIIRKRLCVDSSVALFFTVNGNLCTSNADLSTIYGENKNTDNFLYVKYSSENTFG